MAAISKLHMELATASRNSSYFFEPVKEAFVSAGLTDIEVIDTGESIQVNSDVEGIDVLLSQIAINLGLEEAGAVITQKDNIASIEFSWLNLETAGPLDFEEEEEVEDVPEDVEEALEEDDEMDEEEKEEVKQKIKNGLEVLNTPEAQKLVQRLYQVCNGDNIATFPIFWNELDDICLKYRKQSGYKPEEPDPLEEKASVFGWELLPIAEELAKAKKWVGGRKGFLSALMKGIAQNGADIDKAWDDLDGATIASLLEKVCYPVLDKIAQERKTRGLDEEVVDDTEGSASEETAAGKPYYVLFEYDEENKVWDNVFGDTSLTDLKSEYEWLKDNGRRPKHLVKVKFLGNPGLKDIENYIKRLDGGYKPKSSMDTVEIQ